MRGSVTQALTNEPLEGLDALEDHLDKRHFLVLATHLRGPLLALAFSLVLTRPAKEN